ncbi:MAG: TMEM165/GDT1 family protein [Halobacteriaceae archaeon]
MSEATWLSVLAIAFGAQLAVLPGEKVQFIIAGLSTRYHPLLVVAAAGSAFAGWTVLEILFGRFLQQALPGDVLAVLTAAMFALFAVLLWRSRPDPGVDVAETDGGLLAGAEGLDVRVPVLDWKVPSVLGGFLPIFSMMAFGEFGDKTQLVTITIAATYPAHPTAIWVGEMLAIVPVSLANALFFHRFSHRFDLRKAHLAGAGLFGFFAFDTGLSVLVDVSIWETVVSTVVAGLLGAA